MVALRERERERELLTEILFLQAIVCFFFLTFTMMQHYGSIDQEGQISLSHRKDEEERMPNMQPMSAIQALREQHSRRFYETDECRMEWGRDDLSRGSTEPLSSILTNASSLSNTENNDAFSNHGHAMVKWMNWLPKDERLRRLIGILLAAFILIFFWMCARGGGSSTYMIPHSSSDASISNETYDYIVAGGGPAGILVATELARKLGTSYKILLLEAGTISQSSVMENVYRKQMEDLSAAATKSTKNSAKPYWSMSPFTSFPQLLNQMDIPILWSGVASKATGNQTKTVSDDFHHWHVPKTLLAKALGGCGVHNAM